jgi:hypothetical protein
MKRIRWVVLFVAPALLVGSGQASAAKQQSNRAEKTAAPVWTLAMDGARVAYASGGRIRVWNVVTGATSVVKGKYGNAKGNENASQIAIAGKRVAWIKDQQFGNTEEGEKLYTSSIAGKAKMIDRVYRYGVDDPTLTKGGWIEGLVGSGNGIAVSTWKSNGTSATDQQLGFVTPAGVSPLAGLAQSSLRRRTARTSPTCRPPRGRTHAASASTPRPAMSSNRSRWIPPTPTPPTPRSGSAESFWPS